MPTFVCAENAGSTSSKIELLSMQEEDVSWHVKTRLKPVE
jgi:hypothetical protein